MPMDRSEAIRIIQRTILAFGGRAKNCARQMNFAGADKWGKRAEALQLALDDMRKAQEQEDSNAK